jgi:hypothetical protein
MESQTTELPLLSRSRVMIKLDQGVPTDFGRGSRTAWQSGRENDSRERDFENPDASSAPSSTTHGSGFTRAVV